jgi:hypothetical protein
MVIIQKQLRTILNIRIGRLIVCFDSSKEIFKEFFELFIKLVKICIEFFKMMMT